MQGEFIYFLSLLVILFFIFQMYTFEYIINYFLNHSWFLNLMNGKSIKVVRTEIISKPSKDVKP